MASLDPDLVSPISKLHDDILWCIFNFNSLIHYDLENKTPSFQLFSVIHDLERERTPSLFTSRRTSQVCSRWRKLIVDSPTIWANAIDLHHLRQSRNEWRNEVLKRSGKAPLDILGPAGEEDDSASERPPDFNAGFIPFVLNLLTVHWERIRTLIISSRDARVDEALFAASRCPAPILENFFVGFNDSDLDRKLSSFEGCAPRLRTVGTQFCSFYLAEPTPWFAGVCHLVLSCSQKSLPISELIQGLKEMTSLESFRVFSYNDDHLTQIPDAQQREDIFPTVKFRSLGVLHIEDLNLAGSDLISHIITPPHCTSKLQLDLTDGITEVPESLALCYTKFFQNNFAPRDITHLSFELVPTPGFNNIFDIDSPEAIGYYTLAISIDRSTKQKHEDPDFQSKASLWDMRNLPLVMADALSCYDMSNVTTFSFYINIAEPSIILEHPSLEKFQNFLLGLVSVETLHTDEATLRFYMGSEDLCVTDELFPRLVTVFTDKWDRGLRQFLEFRQSSSDEESGEEGIKRLVFSKYSPVPCDDSAIIEAASRFDLVVDWEDRSGT